MKTTQKSEAKMYVTCRGGQEEGSSDGATVSIISNREGLERLHKALSRVIGETKTENMAVISAESNETEYNLRVVLVSDETLKTQSFPTCVEKPWDKESV